MIITLADGFPIYFRCNIFCHCNNSHIAYSDQQLDYAPIFHLTDSKIFDAK